jgi:hypothetical protein
MSARCLSLGIALVAASAGAAPSDPATSTEPPRHLMVEIKLGGYRPLIDREPSLTGKPYQEIFGGSSMLLFEMELDLILWQKFGTAALGISAGYAEKYGKARLADDPNVLANDSTSLKVIPVRLLGIYRLDYGALRLGIPLVPYGKVGLVAEPWWISKGGSLEFAQGVRGRGTKFGYFFTGGLSFMLDVLEPRMAKDLTTDVGIAHSYIFAEYIYEQVNSFGKRGLDLSSRHWMFGLSLEF